MEWLFSWEASSVIFVLFVSVGLAVLALDDFRLAKTCFLIAAADAIGGTAMFLRKSELPNAVALVLAFVIAGGIGLLTLLSFRYVDLKRAAKEQSKPRANENAGNLRAKQQEVYVKLAQASVARCQAYRDDYVANLNFAALEWQHRKPNRSLETRRTIEQKRDEFLRRSDETIKAVDQTEQQMAQLLAEVQMLFPNSQQLDQAINRVGVRPNYAIEVPEKPQYPENTEELKKFLDTQGERINHILKNDCEIPVEDVLKEMNSLLNG